MKFTSDLHWFHKNILNYTNRKHETSIEEHTEWLIELWNSQVSKGEDVYHLGDLSFGKYDQTAEVLSKLNGNIYLLKGNHDNREHLNKLQHDGLIVKWYDYLERTIEGKHVVMMHFAIATWHKQHYGAIHLHGHTHGNYQGLGKSLDVGLDNAYNLLGKHKFFDWEDIVSFMQKREIYVADHHEQRSGE